MVPLWWQPHGEAFIACAFLAIFLIDFALHHAATSALLDRVSHGSFWLSTSICAPMLVAVFAFAAATTSSNDWMPIHAVFVHFSAAVVVLTIPAASMPDGPPGVLQGMVNFFWFCMMVAAWHAVIVKWESTRSEPATSRHVRLGLVTGIACISSASAIMQARLGRHRFWSVCRLTAFMCGGVRLLAIVLLYREGATTYPPGALPLEAAVSVVCVMPVIAGILTPSNRQRLARASGITQHVQRLVDLGKGADTHVVTLKDPMWHMHVRAER